MKNVEVYKKKPCYDSTGKKKKKQYKTYEEAEEQQKVALKERGLKLDIYKCEDCGYYHLTSRGWGKKN